MDGKIDEIKGKVKKAIGELTDNDKLKAEGTVDKAAGKIKTGVGNLVDGVKDAVQGKR